ncbi:hypothetical protein SERLA73DRAFT_191507 [Serpula lacrymans var. lacrymans S7.3]|uniref:AB hydrolase-1 domain-containing protein n=2 Tax=Serpula lacrymans var. lacrymans TaxID=341189 RepID=F8QHQ5_SERL3|nr:uncharacterized protein SERLADRAFT_463914 [Serpula lacrymans var. lacrymans S7.9]EGN92167.1 hypothetical protein SERLA73DRAFT_191507 [Serpula lacrymans var. lacrymans S7.3]EGO26651.1 hypothetical protein SERLADRAFT_463914 [Serpula lacrymans var. lacrymans S7.9]
MSALEIQSQHYTFDPRPNYPFLITAKRYWVDGPAVNDATASTLILAHAVGFSKEHWEPTLEYLFEHLGHGNHRNKIREVWSIDAPNHGDAAVLNEETLQWGYQPIFRWDEYGRSIHAFLSGLGTGVDVDFSKHNLVGIGHSMGAISVVLSTTYYPLVHYTSIQLIEPMFIGYEWSKARGNFLEDGAMKRRDIWPSQEEAYTILKSRASFKVWDDRILRLYVNHCLRPLPTLDYPDKVEGVTLKCSKAQEAATYRDTSSRVVAHKLLRSLIKRVPTYITYGLIDDYVAPAVKDDVLHNASGGIENYASVIRVKDTGHLIVQTNPRATAEVIRDALLHTIKHVTLSKL